MTPTVNTTLPLNLGQFDTLSAALDYAAKGDTGLNFFDGFGQLTDSCSYHTLREQALLYAFELTKQGVKSGDRIAIIAQTRMAFPALFFACQYLGVVPVPLPFTVFLGGKKSYIEKLRHMIDLANPVLVITPENIAECAFEATSLSKIHVSSFEVLSEQISNQDPSQTPKSLFVGFSKTDPAYIQFSSGSTTKPKGILVSQADIQANIQAILQEGMKLQETDRACSWLPFYHDMGLVGLLLAAISGQRSVDYLSSSTFARRPTLWLELMSKNKSTITFAPDSGYLLAAQRLKPETELDLSTLRIAGLGGDMIRAETLKTVSEQLSKYHFKELAFMPSYGLAEATLAITMASVETPLQLDNLEQNGSIKTVVSCGKPLSQYSIKIMDEHHLRLPEKIIGQIWVKGPSIIPSYLDTQQNQELDTDGYMNTGDLGYLLNEQLYVTGRTKDLIIIHGRNIWVQDIEYIVDQALSNVNHGKIIAMGIESPKEDTLVVLIENKTFMPPETQIVQKNMVQTAINQFAGIQAQVLFVPAHSLSMTSSGKLARTLIKDDYLKNKLSIL